MRMRTLYLYERLPRAVTAPILKRCCPGRQAAVESHPRRTDPLQSSTADLAPSGNDPTPPP